MFSRVLRSSANTARLRTRHVGGARKFSVPPKAAKPCNGKSQGSDDSYMYFFLGVICFLGVNNLYEIGVTEKQIRRFFGDYNI